MTKEHGEDLFWSAVLMVAWAGVLAAFTVVVWWMHG